MIASETLILMQNRFVLQNSPPIWRQRTSAWRFSWTIEVYFRSKSRHFKSPQNNSFNIVYHANMDEVCKSFFLPELLLHLFSHETRNPIIAYKFSFYNLHINKQNL